MRWWEDIGAAIGGFIIAMIATVIAFLFWAVATGSKLEPAKYGPAGNCVTWHDLKRNRPYPPPHRVHSYANEVPICE